ncbi:hypothetical protein [Lacticaseibacillus porcinae]|uniref:hypothetical protein n=1 Tax=Lacticaseibacillus porcinae TaxID=1123687 RepID=UPI0013DD9B64|nr:hypothetical protein [Lacticaseibacillus porcinae]
MTKNTLITIIGGIFVMIGMICLYLSGTTMLVLGVSFNVIGWCIILTNYWLRASKRRD